MHIYTHAHIHIHTQILKHLLVALDAEGRHHVLNAVVNQLRYPNR